MEYTAFNNRKYNRRKQWYRLLLGGQPFVFYPFLNISWIGIIIIGTHLYKALNQLSSAFSLSPISKTIFSFCLDFTCNLLIILIIIFILQTIGEIIAKNDEASIMEEIKNGDVNSPYVILIYKKRNIKTKITKRIFYTNIPMEVWRKRENAICDNLSIRTVVNIDYYKSYGNRIVIESANGRIAKERGAIYDELE